MRRKFHQASLFLLLCILFPWACYLLSHSDSLLCYACVGKWIPLCSHLKTVIARNWKWPSCLEPLEGDHGSVGSIDEKGLQKTGL